jgi:hypothetical protein
VLHPLQEPHPRGDVVRAGSLAVGAVGHENSINVNVNVNVEPCLTLTSAPRKRMLALESTRSTVLEPHCPAVIADFAASRCCPLWWRLKAYTHHVSGSARLRNASIAQEEQSFSIMWTINMRRRPRPNAKHPSNAKFVKVVNSLRSSHPAPGLDHPKRLSLGDTRRAARCKLSVRFGERSSHGHVEGRCEVLCHILAVHFTSVLFRLEQLPFW